MHDILINWIKNQSLLNNITIHNLRMKRKAKRSRSVAVQSRNKYLFQSTSYCAAATAHNKSVPKVFHSSQLGAPMYSWVTWDFSNNRTLTRLTKQGFNCDPPGVFKPHYLFYMGFFGCFLFVFFLISTNLKLF